jgi:predicted transcriptional regulator
MDKRTQIAIKLPPDLLTKLDKARAAMPVAVTRTAIIEAAIENWLTANAKGTRK